ncbi:hypothetical protein PVAP13_6NG268093 [Panicum virgatum]|uniref:Secreted protein n=1 Tax=Panicum virgatum TaxID=38727 RepID=A0A8T0R284_PANVG|nr:hypothetical protein PVAP13_6NG268093 [Panicum virgatum]
MPFQFVVFFCCCVAYAAGSRCCPAAALRRRKPQPLLVRGPAALIRQGTLRSWPLAPEGASPCEESPPVRQRRAADPIRRAVNKSRRVSTLVPSVHISISLNLNLKLQNHIETHQSHKSKGSRTLFFFSFFERKRAEEFHAPELVESAEARGFFFTEKKGERRGNGRALAALAGRRRRASLPPARGHRQRRGQDYRLDIVKTEFGKTSFAMLSRMEQSLCFVRPRSRVQHG